MGRDALGRAGRTRSECRQRCGEVLVRLAEFGFALLRGAPVESGTVLRAVELFGFVRETNYGRLFDVRAVVEPTNLAFTSLPLGPHTDNPYRDPVPTLQLLHCLTSNASGGDTTLVDGFAAAEARRRQDPDAFALLSRHPISFRYRDVETDLEARTPVIRLDAEGTVTGLRFNNRSKGPLGVPAPLVRAYHGAYRAFARLLEHAELQLVLRLEPGDILVFDNERVLHGRTGYDGAGTRHLQGCYADRDGARSRLAVLDRRSAS
ncbi:MAG TPA: TauD/TfdA family dioxygenase [Gaiellaceae bacterium]|nr:TauD/TfdA family dioxygenase [Gaiellaceae bacterium]